MLGNEHLDAFAVKGAEFTVLGGDLIGVHLLVGALASAVGIRNCFGPLPEHGFTSHLKTALTDEVMKVAQIFRALVDENCPEWLDGDINFRKGCKQTLALLSLEANLAADGKCPQLFTVGGFLSATMWLCVTTPMPNLNL